MTAQKTFAFTEDQAAGSGSDLRLVRSLRVLNLFAGLGGNRKDWQNVEVTSVEMEPDIAEIYKRQHPQDTLVIGDAHAYLLEHHEEFDLIWTSPPCQTHSKMAKATRHKRRRYPDMMLYQQIIFLQHFFKGAWVVENVTPYYEPLIQPQKVGRHCFWSNFPITAQKVKQPKGFITGTNVAAKLALQEWLGIHYPENIYYGTNHCPAQILRNCVHPKVGSQVMDSARQFLANDEPSHP
jgi:DNA (cytosine-5)-methyltransferase 1